MDQYVQVQNKTFLIYLFKYFQVNPGKGTFDFTIEGGGGGGADGAGCLSGGGASGLACFKPGGGG